MNSAAVELQQSAETFIPPNWLVYLFAAMALFGIAAWFVAIVRLASGKPPIAYEERSKVPWGWSGSALAALILLNTIASLVSKASSNEEPSPTLIDYEIVVGMGSLYLLLIVFVVAWHRNASCAKWSDFGFPVSADQFARHVILGTAMAAAALIPVYIVQSLLVLAFGMPSSHPLVEQLVGNSTLEVLIPAILLAVVIAPLFEEFAFRVMLQSSLEKVAKTDSYWPIVASSFLFAIVHQGQGYAPIPLFVLACFFGYLYRQTHSLVPCVVAHMVFNGLSVVVAYAAATAS